MNFQKFLQQQSSSLAREWDEIERQTGREYSTFLKKVRPQTGVERLGMKYNPETREPVEPDWETFSTICSRFPKLYNHYLKLMELEPYNIVPIEIDEIIKENHLKLEKR